MKKRVFVFILALCCLFASGCGIHRGKATDAGFVDKRTGVEYVLTDSLALYAVTKGEEYVQVGDETYFTVLHEDASRFLCIEDSGELLVFRASDVAEPTVSSFGAIAAGIFVNNTTYITSLYADDEYLPEDKQGLNPTQDTALCRSIAAALTDRDAENVDPASITEEDVYFIRLYSQSYPGLYYLVVFFGDNTGRYYLRDRANGKTVICPREVVARMVGEQ